MTQGKKKSGWSLDIPGGKRHLGESSLQGTLREANEEVSFYIDELDFRGWLKHDHNGNIIPRENKKEPENVYFVATPPEIETDLSATMGELKIDNDESENSSSL
uniref:Nudix hydrolase domain-containing protein n=1 Tax=Eucampia antarctica TaxID=49252 RepID=A0A7S2RFA7_9STRA|mmetsp:Transcript_21416/g.20565  ORF Transcript_21416/g.20565 Transcript_21416/m.20565 type:complete len:104 (+) Transcript_21416:81-392(+)